MAVSEQHIKREYQEVMRFAIDHDYKNALFHARLCAEFVCREVFLDRIQMKPDVMTLDGFYQIFKKHNIMNDKILSHLRTVQIHGNFASHANEEEPDQLTHDSTLPALKGILIWFCSTYQLNNDWLNDVPASPIKQKPIENVFYPDDKNGQTPQVLKFSLSQPNNYHPQQNTTENISMGTSQDTFVCGQNKAGKLIIYCDDRSLQRKDGWVFWLVQEGNEFVKLAGSRLSGANRVYEMYCRFSGHIRPDLETTRQEIFVQWFQKSFGRDPFRCPSYTERKIRQVNPQVFFTDTRSTLWRDTAKLYQQLDTLIN